jgi:hypothetical protein
MRIDSSGNLLVGQTSWSFANNGTQIAANGRIYNTSNTDYNLELAGSTSARIRFYTSAGGSGTTVGSVTVNTTTTTYATSSDYRLKNITGAVTADEAKNFIMALQPKQGTWKADGSKFVGFLAHEFQAVSPTSVSGEKDAVDQDGKPVYQGMQAASSEVMANLIALVQQQQTLIQDLTTRLTTLEGN